jgi:gluconate kinase
MPPGLLANQLATLEEPAGVLAVDVTSSPAQSVAAIRRGIGV